MASLDGGRSPSGCWSIIKLTDLVKRAALDPVDLKMSSLVLSGVMAAFEDGRSIAFNAVAAFEDDRVPLAPRLIDPDEDPKLPSLVLKDATAAFEDDRPLAFKVVVAFEDDRLSLAPRHFGSDKDPKLSALVSKAGAFELDAPSVLSSANLTDAPLLTEEERNPESLNEERKEGHSVAPAPPAAVVLDNDADLEEEDDRVDAFLPTNSSVRFEKGDSDLESRRLLQKGICRFSRWSFSSYVSLPEKGVAGLEEEDRDDICLYMDLSGAEGRCWLSFVSLFERTFCFSCLSFSRAPRFEKGDLSPLMETSSLSSSSSEAAGRIAPSPDNSIT